MNMLTVLMAFAMGLTGSLHCAGMCGPIIWVMPFQAMTGFRKWVGIALYHFGRISVYALLGLLLHSFKSVFHPQWQQYVSVSLGALLLLIGIGSFLPHSMFRVNFPWVAFVRNRLSYFMGNPGLYSLLLTGALNGLLPCGLVYMALTVSITADTAVQSMLLMYAFGSGTVPMLVALTLLKNKVGFVRNWKMRKLVPALMFVFGCLFILRGMNQGIPYLSPKIEVAGDEVKTTCCHK